MCICEWDPTNEPVIFGGLLGPVPTAQSGTPRLARLLCVVHKSKPVRICPALRYKLKDDTGIDLRVSSQWCAHVLKLQRKLIALKRHTKAELSIPFPFSQTRSAAHEGCRSFHQTSDQVSIPILRKHRHDLMKKLVQIETCLAKRHRRFAV